MYTRRLHCIVATMGFGAMLFPAGGIGAQPQRSTPTLRGEEREKAQREWHARMQQRAKERQGAPPGD